MTAEVAIINRSAVALAADSLVTVTTERHKKTWEVNKLFALSKHQPVGIMVYDSAEFLKLPWETVIKSYRKDLGNRAYPTLQKYAEHFFDWIATSPIVCNEQDQQDQFLGLLQGFYKEIVLRKIDRIVKQTIGESGPISRKEIGNIASEVIHESHQYLTGLGRRSSLPADLNLLANEKYSELLAVAIKKYFAKMPISDEDNGLLKDCARLLFENKFPLPTHSGVVFAGFGENQALPEVLGFHIYGAVNAKPIYDADENGSIRNGDAAILPFAQRNTVDTLLRGINDEDFGTIAEYLKMLSSRLPIIIADSIQMDQSQQEELINKLQTATSDALENFNSKIDSWLNRKHVEPLLDALPSLPKEEMADLAESLVSVTSLKQKISLGIETVGGPIDVAIITKGDGFIWLKRKHYFNPELNQSFLSGYFER